VKEKKEQRGRNPETRGDLMPRARRVVTFGCSPALRDKLNGEKWGFDLLTNVEKIGGMP
jgi:nucleoid DNA-binding protein